LGFVLLSIKKSKSFHLVDVSARLLAAVQPVVDEAQKSSAWGWPQYTLVAIGVIAVSYAGIYFVGPYFITILEQLITPQDVFSQLVRGPTDAVVEKITASLTSYASLPGVTDLSIGLFVEQIAKALRYSWGDDQAAQILYIVLTKMPINTVSDVYAHLWV
jgi:hypothetical protein